MEEEEDGPELCIRRTELVESSYAELLPVRPAHLSRCGACALQPSQVLWSRLALHAFHLFWVCSVQSKCALRLRPTAHASGTCT